MRKLFLSIIEKFIVVMSVFRKAKKIHKKQEAEPPEDFYPHF